MCHERIRMESFRHALRHALWKPLHLGKRSSLIKLAWTRIWGEPDKYIDHIYGEREGRRDRMAVYLRSPVLKLDFPMEYWHDTLPENTKDFLSIVNLTLISWPAVFGGIYLMTKKDKKIS